MEGLQNGLISKSRTTNYYGFTGELAKTVTDNYETRLSAAIPSDYRSGQISDKKTTWTNISESLLYRKSRVVVEYQYNKNQNIQDTYTWTSSTSRGSGKIGRAHV